MIPYMKPLKNNRLAVGLIVSLLLITTGLSLTGCGDNSSYESKMFDALQALDDENWEQARAILETLPENEEVLQYLSNSYAGSVGINTFDFLTTIDELDSENTGDDQTGSIDMIGKLIGAQDDVLPCDLATEKLEDITTAIETMVLIQTLTGLELNDDQKVQLGLASITRTVLIIAKLICYEIQPDDSVTMTEEWLDLHHDDFYPVSQGAWDSSPVATSYADMLMEDISNVAEAITALSDSNDIQDDFNQFRSDLDNGQGISSTALDGVISLDEMNYYLDNM